MWGPRPIEGDGALTARFSMAAGKIAKSGERQVKLVQPARMKGGPGKESAPGGFTTRFSVQSRPAKPCVRGRRQEDDDITSVPEEGSGGGRGDTPHQHLPICDLGFKLSKRSLLGGTSGESKAHHIGGNLTPLNFPVRQGGGEGDVTYLNERGSPGDPRGARIRLFQARHNNNGEG